MCKLLTMRSSSKAQNGVSDALIHGKAAVNWVGCWSVIYQIEEFGFEGSRTVEQVESVAEMPDLALDDSSCECLQ
jgi:hypothetical protein